MHVATVISRHIYQLCELWLVYRLYASTLKTISFVQRLFLLCLLFGVHCRHIFLLHIFYLLLQKKLKDGGAEADELSLSLVPLPHLHLHHHSILTNTTSSSKLHHQEKEIRGTTKKFYHPELREHCECRDAAKCEVLPEWS